GGGHINYPWLIPLSQFWMHETLGEYNDLTTNFIFFFYFIFIIILLYYFIRKYASRFIPHLPQTPRSSTSEIMGSKEIIPAGPDAPLEGAGFIGLLFAFMFSTMPLIFYHAYNVYADLPLGYYGLIAFALLFSWTKDKERKDLILSAIFFGIALWVKTEALFFISSSALVLGYYLFYSKFIESRLKIFINFLLSILIIISPILFFNFKYSLGMSNIDLETGFHSEVFKSLFESLFMGSNWNIWWIIVVVIFVLNIKMIIKKKELLVGWLFLFIVLGEFLAVYLFTNDYQYAVNHTAISRNIIPLLPIAIFLVSVIYFNASNVKELRDRTGEED
ncbi:MAG: hypothetical protein AAB217_03905, partial [Chloroflexota bacterium]